MHWRGTLRRRRGRSFAPSSSRWHTVGVGQETVTLGSQHARVRECAQSGPFSDSTTTPPRLHDTPQRSLNEKLRPAHSLSRPARTELLNSGIKTDSLRVDTHLIVSSVCELVYIPLPCDRGGPRRRDTAARQTFQNESIERGVPKKKRLQNGSRKPRFNTC